MSYNQSDYDFLIYGAGLAGLSLADALRERGCRVCLIEKERVGAGASGTPLGLINPATGRRGTKVWRAEKCYAAVTTCLEKVSFLCNRPFFKRNGVLRPALSKKIARKMKEQFEKTEWPDKWCLWLTEEEVLARHPGINCVDGGLWIPAGITVDVLNYLKTLALFLKKAGVRIETGTSPEPIRSGDGWTASLDGESLTAPTIIYATGYALAEDPRWESLPLHPIKGQVAVFEPEKPLSFGHSISSLGYIAHLDNNRYVQGSTYEHDFESTEPDRFGEEYLRNRLKRTLPSLEQNSRLKEQWAGVRISSPNRKPVMGLHPDLPGLAVFTALGSKGLMYGRHMADLLADHLVKGKPLLKAVDVKRFFDES